jgi:hypothetical protein
VGNSAQDVFDNGGFFRRQIVDLSHSGSKVLGRVICDLSGAFLGTEFRDRAVYIKLPNDAGVHVGKILLMKKVYMV